MYPSIDTPQSAAPVVPESARSPSARQGPGRRQLEWLDDRLGLSALRYRVPVHANTLWYTLGGITLMGIVVLVLTGIWLAQYYNPDPAAARNSVVYLQNEVRLGDVIRGIHIWTAYLVVMTGSLHLIRVFVTASYKVPREVNWLVGLAMLGLLLAAVFTGTVLRWDQEGYEAMIHNMEIASFLGAIGGFFSDTFTTSVPMLPRLYIAHVSLIPVILFLALAAHIFLIKHHGISSTPAQADAGEAPNGRLPEARVTGRYQTHLRIMFGYGLALLGLAGTLAVNFPQPVGPAPDPTIEVTKPPFIFYWLYAFEDWWGVKGILYAIIGVFGTLALFSFIDRTPLRHLGRRPLAVAIGVVLLVVVAALSIKVGTAPAARHLD